MIGRQASAAKPIAKRSARRVQVGDALHARTSNNRSDARRRAAPSRSDARRRAAPSIAVGSYVPPPSPQNRGEYTPSIGRVVPATFVARECVRQYRAIRAWDAHRPRGAIFDGSLAKCSCRPLASRRLRVSPMEPCADESHFPYFARTYRDCYYATDPYVRDYYACRGIRVPSSGHYDCVVYSA
jgi:hypothetical protein